MLLFDQPNDPKVLANFKEVRRMKYTEARNALDKKPYFQRLLSEQKVFKRHWSASELTISKPPAKIGFVGWNALEPENEQEESPRFWKKILITTTAFQANPTYVVTSQTVEPSVLSVHEPSFVGASLQDQARIIDCGASESIVGSFILQDFRDELIDLGFDANAEMSIDRGVQKSFLFGNDRSSNALGMAKFTAGLCDQEQVIEAHVVDGGTPMLLSSKWLHDQEAVINFKTGLALFPKISSQQVQLERSSTFHLMLPLNAFGGRTEIVAGLFL